MEMPNPIVQIVAAVSTVWWPVVLAHSKESSYRIIPPTNLAALPGKDCLGNIGPAPNPYRTRNMANEPARVAAGGFCVVTLRDAQQWIPGSTKFRLVLDGNHYLFSTERARDIFLASPELYMPVLNGDCIVTLAATGERQLGQLQWGLVYDQRIYFFASERELKEFEWNPKHYSDIDLMDNGFCVVSKVDEGRLIKGPPETVAIVDGMRYHFASKFHRKQFYSSFSRYVSEGTARVDSEIQSEITNHTEAQWDNFSTMASHPFGWSSLASLLPTADRKGKLRSGNASDRQASEQIDNRALAGYCPVTIYTQGVWQRGKSKFKSTYDGKVYFMVGPEELAAFRANPREYMPVLGGDSVVSLVNDYQRVPGSVFYAVQYQRRLYLLADAEQKTTFSQQPSQFLNADLAENGNCVVTRIAEKKEIAGSPEYEAVYLGMRYHFSTAEKLKKFLTEPKAYVQ